MDWDTAYRTLSRSADDALREFIARSSRGSVPRRLDIVRVSDAERIEAARAIGRDAATAPFAPADLQESEAAALRFACVTEGAILLDISDELFVDHPVPDPSVRARARLFIEARLNGDATE